MHFISYILLVTLNLSEEYRSPERWAGPARMKGGKRSLSRKKIALPFGKESRRRRMPLKQELQELAMAKGMKYFGIAPVDRFANMPEGHRPNDLLPGAKSVFVMGMVVPDGASGLHVRAMFNDLPGGAGLSVNRITVRKRTTR